MTISRRWQFVSGAAAILVAASTVSAVTCDVRQLDWLNDDGTVQIQFSRVGEIVFQFDPADPQDQILLGGGFVNVVTNLNDWNVQNLYLNYEAPEHLASSRPAVQFGLPLDNGIPLVELLVHVTITPFPLEEPPVGLPSPKTVAHYGYHAGGFEGGGTSLSIIPLILGPWIGPFIPGPTDIAFTDFLTPIRPVDEETNGCAPASAARSIQYMGDVNGFATAAAQSIYDDLKDDMGTSVGPDSSGTTVPDFLSGKCEYVDENNLPIDTEQVFGIADICAAADAIAAGGDVEIMIAWDGGGGHAAMVTGIVKWPDGSATITYVDDPTQGDGVAENQEHVIHVNPDGTFDGGSIIGFQIETVDPCPIDLNGNGGVDFQDLVTLLASWGDCPGPGSCEADFNGDGEVGFQDLVTLLSAWGPCEGE